MGILLSFIVHVIKFIKYYFNEPFQVVNLECALFLYISEIILCIIACNINLIKDNKTLSVVRLINLLFPSFLVEYILKYIRIYFTLRAIILNTFTLI